MSTKPYTNVTLQNLDIYFAIDRSGSMLELMPNKQTRFDYCQETILPFAAEVGKFDDDGITFCFFNRQFTMHDNVKPEGIVPMFKSTIPGGGTALHEPLKAILDLAVKRCNEKQQFVCVMTDGKPDSEDEVIRVIVNATRQISDNGKIAILFLQVGADPGASAFLRKLDNDLKPAGARFDIVAVKQIDDIAGRPIQDVVNDAFNN